MLTERVPFALRQQELSLENDGEASIPPRIATLLQRIPEEASRFNPTYGSEASSQTALKLCR